MLFNSVVFLFAFLPITYVVFWTLRAARARYAWLTLTGYVFYGYWDARFCALMAFSTCVSFVAGLGFARWPDRARHARARRVCLVAPIVVDLALLGFFKYAGFALDSARGLAHLLGADVAVPPLAIVLPIGISFYTFHTITYIVDCYRGVVTPTRDLLEFSTYVSLFSQLVAGPIVRFRQIERDLAAIARADRARWIVPGLSFLAIGLVEKVLVADSLAAFVDPALAEYGGLSTAGAWVAMTGYALQLYFDFSGYSTMAVGLGFLFGLHIPRNFDAPYKALDPSDFWRRWHISLSSVLRDYLYVPLGGNRAGAARTYRNLMLTMLLGGLWHGAAWTFVAWGAYHGVLLCAYRRWGGGWDRLPRVVRQAGMFGLAVVGWVFFRSTSFGMAASLLGAMFHLTPGGTGAPVERLPLVALALAVSAWWAMVGPSAFDLAGRGDAAALRGVARPSWRRDVALTLALASSLALIIGSRPSPFLYFQF